MSDDYTQHQTLGEQLQAEKLSLQTTTPPAEIPGYRMERFLGAGAFGQVWVAQDLNTGRQVAIKFYLHRSGVNWSLLSREVKNLVALSADRHIVQVLEVGWDVEPPYYVMEHIPNGSLEDLLQQRGQLPVEQAVSLFRDICTGLNHTHGKGILHCDLKPANILLDEDYRPRLADFGQSRMSHEQTPALGTLFYMAPEQADLDTTPDARWDVYGLGAILYRMLTGKAPHRDERILNQVDTDGSLPQRLAKYRDAIRESLPATEHHKIRGVDRRLASIIDRCIAADPEQRFGNVQQVVEAIAERDSTKARRPLILLGIVGPLLLLAATCLYGSLSIRKTGRQFKEALREERAKTNLSAAGEKARALEIELRSYFYLVGREASESGFVDRFRETVENSRLTELRRHVADRTNAIDARQAIFDERLCDSLNDYLVERLRRHNERAESEVGVPRLATMFVTDNRGTIIGIAYAEPVPFESNSSGRNYVYRTYFTGLKEDLPRDTLPQNVGSIVQNTHLSAAFQSTATGLWKVAVSTPIRIGKGASGSNMPVDGVFVATTNLGEFEQFRVGEGSPNDAIGVLVDARSGPLRGTILQHPWMIEAPGETRAESRFQVPGGMMDRLLKGGDFEYFDPIASADGGQRYRGEWIAAVHPVHVPHLEDSSSTDTDLLVLVQFRLSQTIARVESLTTALIWEGAIAVLGILMINGLMWYLARNITSPSISAEVQKEPAVPKGLEETISIQ